MAGRSGQRWLCSVCGGTHGGLATIFGPHVPEPWRRATPDERNEGLIGPELCSITIDGRMRHFVRGHLEIPVEDPQLDPFVWSVWVELDEGSMAQLVGRWEQADRDQDPPLEGVLATDLPYRESTMGLLVRLQSRPLGEVPAVTLAPSFEHELVHEQYEGISAHRVAEINRTVQD